MPCTVRIYLAVLSLAAVGVVRAQVVHPDTLGVPPREPGLDSSAQARVGLDHVTGAKIDTVAVTHHPTKSPMLAMGLSALCPGAGQVYNESYWKAPIVLGLGIYFLSYWLDYNRRYLEYKEKFQNDPSNLAYLRVREFYHDQRDTYTWYFLILYFANIADAYVDASLYDFNVGTDLSIRMMPIRSGFPDGSPQLQFRLTF